MLQEKCYAAWETSLWVEDLQAMKDHLTLRSKGNDMVKGQVRYASYGANVQGHGWSTCTGIPIDAHGD